VDLAIVHEPADKGLECIPMPDKCHRSVGDLVNAFAKFRHSPEEILLRFYGNTIVIFGALMPPRIPKMGKRQVRKILSQFLR